MTNRSMTIPFNHGEVELTLDVDTLDGRPVDPVRFDYAFADVTSIAWTEIISRINASHLPSVPRYEQPDLTMTKSTSAFGHTVSMTVKVATTACVSEFDLLAILSHGFAEFHCVAQQLAEPVSDVISDEFRDFIDAIGLAIIVGDSDTAAVTEIFGRTGLLGSLGKDSFRINVPTMRV